MSLIRSNPSPPDLAPPLAEFVAAGLEPPTAGSQIPDFDLGKMDDETRKRLQKALDDDPDEDDDESLTFEQLNLQVETIRLFRQTRRLMRQVLRETGVPANQKAQVANTLASLLKGLSAQQTELYNAERLKRLEFVIIRFVREMPDPEQERFMSMYEAEVNV